MSSEPMIDESARIVRGAAPRAVTVHREMAFSGRLTHCLDYVVLVHVLFAISAGEEITVPGIWKRLQALGIRSSKKDDVLVGRDAVYQAFNRIIEAGFIRRVELPNLKHPGRKGPVKYEVYEFPEDNPAWNATDDSDGEDGPDASASPQVGMLPGYPEAENGKNTQTSVSAGQNASRVAGSGYSGSGYPGSGTQRVPAGQNASGYPGSGSALPPTPPRGMDIPPTPHVTSVPSTSVDAVTGGGGGKRSARGKANPAVDSAAIQAATEFLLDLPGEWACGLDSARKNAPVLLDVCAVTGWELGPELVAELTKDGRGLIKPARAIPRRIKELPKRRSAAAPAATPSSAAERCPWHPSRELATCPCQIAHHRDPARQTPDGPSMAPGAAAAAIKSLTEGAASTRSRKGRLKGLEAIKQRNATEEASYRAQMLAGLEKLANDPSDS
ncbi:hypothetical protein ACWGCW_31490 [Streptomyces sp. NPDC054933]